MIYQQLITMGFDEKLSFEASKKYNNIDKCVQFIINKTKKNNKNINKQSTDDIKQNVPHLHGKDKEQKTDETIQHQVKIYLIYIY